MEESKSHLRISASSAILLSLSNGELVFELNHRCFVKEARLVVTPLGGGLQIKAPGITFIHGLGGVFERPPDENEVTDIRIRLPHDSLPDFQCWFDARVSSDRECSSQREFIEEIIEEHGIPICGDVEEKWICGTTYRGLSDHAKQESLPTLYVQEIFQIGVSGDDLLMIEKKCRHFRSNEPSFQNRLLSVTQEELENDRAPHGSKFARGCRSLLFD